MFFGYFYHRKDLSITITTYYNKQMINLTDKNGKRKLKTLWKIRITFSVRGEILRQGYIYGSIHVLLSGVLPESTAPGSIVLLPEPPVVFPGLFPDVPGA